MLEVPNSHHFLVFFSMFTCKGKTIFFRNLRICQKSGQSCFLNFWGCIESHRINSFQQSWFPEIEEKIRLVWVWCSYTICYVQFSVKNSKLKSYNFFSRTDEVLQIDFLEHVTWRGISDIQVCLVYLKINDPLIQLNWWLMDHSFFIMVTFSTVCHWSVYGPSAL